MFDIVSSFKILNNYLGINFFHPGKGVVKLKWMSVLLLCISLLISCSSVPYVILPDYQDVKIKNKELLIVEIDSSLVQVDLSILGNKNLQKEYLIVFKKSFENGIAEASSFLKISTNKLNRPEIIIPQEVSLPTGEKINLFFPKTEKIITDTAMPKVSPIRFIAE